MGKTNWTLIRREYIDALQKEGECNLRELANKHKVKYATLRSKKSREDWDNKAATKAQQSCNNATKLQQGKTGGKGGAQASQRKAPQKKQSTVAPGNLDLKLQKDARGNNFRHGLYEKFLPPELLEIIEELHGAGPVEILLMNAEMLSAQIVRSMRIMHVRNKEDHTKETKAFKGKGSNMLRANETEYDIQYAWDKHGNMLKAIATAMRELRNHISKLIELDEKGYTSQEQKLRIEKLRLEVEQLHATEEAEDNDLAEYIIKAAQRRAQSGTDETENS